MDKYLGVNVYDSDNNAVRGAAVTYKVKFQGQVLELGPVEIQGEKDHPASIQIPSELDDSVIEVTASYKGHITTKEVDTQQTSNMVITLDRLSFKVRLGILHITDLHMGQSHQDDFLPTMRQGFLRDIRRCYRTSGPWDLVLFSGDLAFSGSVEQFAQVDAFIADLYRTLSELGSGDAVFLSIPGNHDLRRPAETNSGALVLSLLDSLSHELGVKVWNEIFQNPDSEYRRLIDGMFADYRAWWSPWAEKAMTRLDSFQTGQLPGEFSATLIKEGCRFGLVGLNTTALQVRGGDFVGKLAVHARQFNRLLPGTGLDWFDTLDAGVLITHQPPAWLSPQNLVNVFEPLIARGGRFALHLCGHQHIAAQEIQARGGSDARRLQLGRSLLALEPTSDGLERLIGYQSFQIIIDPASSEGLVRAWPRKGSQIQNNDWEYGPDTSFNLDEDNGTPDLPVNRFRRLNRVR
jgi:predicted MPP superfamily phosphohydrolase